MESCSWVQALNRRQTKDLSKGGYMKIDMKKQLVAQAKTHRDMGDPLCIEEIASIAADIQRQNIEHKQMHDELIFVGYTNGYQVLYATEKEGGEGSFYSDTDNDCYIPLYMLKTHWHRLQSTTNGAVTLERIKEARQA